MLKNYEKILIGFNVIAGLCCVAIAYKFILSPMIAETVYRDEYKNAMFQCDNVMRDHLIAKNRVMVEKTRDSLNKLEMAELALLTCHDYDKLRKKLISKGLSQNDLARIGLEAIEEKKKDLREFIKTHEFSY